MYTLKNKVTLIGHLGANPEVRELPNTSKHARFSLATKETYKNEQGEKVEETQWHSIVCFGKVAEMVEKYCEKGTEIAVEGRLTNRKYQDQEGNTRFITEVEVDEFLLLDKQKDKDNG